MGAFVCIKSIHGSVTNYGTYVTDVVEPAYVQYETVTPVRTFLKYRTYSNYYPVYYGAFIAHILLENSRHQKIVRRNPLNTHLF